MFSRSVDVLVADLATVDVDEDQLSVAELGRALGIASPAMLRQYLAAHTWLRERLSDYLDVPGSEITFAEREHGKPVIAVPYTDLSFNLSYANDLAVLALGFRMDVGVDVVSLEGAKVNPEMIHRVLSRPEADSVLSAPDMRKEFYKLFVRREAMAKAHGGGDIQSNPGFNVLGLSPVSRDGLEVTDVNLGEGFAAAVAVPVGCSIELTALVGAAA
jgi:4'-phosphopantetheinyl transferase